MKHILKTGFVALAFTGCNLVDPYAAPWSQLSVGDSRARAEQVMGKPTNVHSVEVPLVKLEQVFWRVPGGRLYVLHFALDRVVAKTVLD